nr:hypothetical protein [uncultured Psychrobacter sp.]
MNTSTIFKAAHALTKATIQTGDSYSATFAICLKAVYAENKAFEIIEALQIEVVSGADTKKLTLNYDDNGVFILSKDGTKKAYVSYLDKKEIKLRNATFSFELTGNAINDFAAAFINCYSSDKKRKLKIIKAGAEFETWNSDKDGALFSVYSNHEYVRTCYTYA